jgi:hypothetical protein
MIFTSPDLLRRSPWSMTGNVRELEGRYNHLPWAQICLLNPNYLVAPATLRFKENLQFAAALLWRK